MAANYRRLTTVLSGRRGQRTMYSDASLAEPHSQVVISEYAESPLLAEWGMLVYADEQLSTRRCHAAISSIRVHPYYATRGSIGEK
jgi:hypothetical protein